MLVEMVAGGLAAQGFRDMLIALARILLRV
jgi:hypothetical protein